MEGSARNHKATRVKRRSGHRRDEVCVLSLGTNAACGRRPCYQGAAHREASRVVHVRIVRTGLGNSTSHIAVVDGHDDEDEHGPLSSERDLRRIGTQMCHKHVAELPKYVKNVYR